MALPFDENFDTSASLTPFTLIDANGDGNGTGWDSPEWLYDEQYGCALYYGKRDVVADDWLITPSLEMDPSSVYKLTFKYYAYYGFGSKFRVAIGSSPRLRPWTTKSCTKRPSRASPTVPESQKRSTSLPERATRS